MICVEIIPSVFTYPAGAFVSSNVYVPYNPTGIPSASLNNSSPPIFHLSFKLIYPFLSVLNTHVLNGVNPEVSSVFSL